jgi:aspartyl-tRNA(Asn)/glutamyl-tRNA(Gln) amidotransferase subunit C
MTNAENVLREDHANSSIDHEQAMKNGPDADSDYFKVPKVVDK